MKMKTTIVISLLLAMIMAFTSCNLIEVNEERDLETIVMKIDGRKVKKGEYIQVYNGIVSANQLTEARLNDPDTAQLVQDSAIDELTIQIILELKAEEYGCYDFSQEELDAIQEELANSTSYYREIAESSITGNEDNGDKTQEELDFLIEAEYVKYLELTGFNEKENLESIRDQKALEKLTAIISKTEPFTESQLEEEYNIRVEAQRTGLEDGTIDYNTLIANGDTIYYTPDNMRKARHILISLPTDVQEYISSLRELEDFVGIDDFRVEELAKIEDEANTVYALAVGGDDFDELIAEYGKDTGMGEDNFYSMTEDSTFISVEFAAGLFSIDKVDGISELIASDIGYHIIKYLGDHEAGAVAFDDVKDIIQSDLTDEAEWEKTIAQMEIWQEEADVKVYSGKLN